MKILALEFSSSQRSVAVVQTCGTGVVLRSEEVLETGGTGTKPFAMITQALQQAGVEREQIECLALGLGPGSYTGVRIAIALAQGWQLANAVKLLGVSSADCIAAEAAAVGIVGPLSVIIDAQRNEFYLARYEADAKGCRALQPLRLATMAEVQKWQAAGEFLVGPEIFKGFSPSRVVRPRAATLGALVAHRNDFVSGDKLEPIYLRETKFVKAPPGRVLG